jgi:Glycosyltransferase (GlcNAc)
MCWTFAEVEMQGSEETAVVKHTIFVSIASYRDPELAATIDDCLTKASHPGRLRFGVGWQHGAEEPRPPQFSSPQFRVLDIDWRSSRGACWARAQIMKLWEGEDWFLQLDSHHRFVEGWDEKLLAQATRTGSAKPVLTTYAGPYTPGDPTPLRSEPMRMEFDRFTEDGLVIFRPGAIPDWEKNTAPRRARFASAHFLFTPGGFVEEVPYDPNLYFIGEEITLTVRAFARGYDLFHPGEVILWHEYTRNNRPKHWDDHTAGNGVKVEWHQRDERSRKIARRLLTRAGHPSCVGERSLLDYEAYAGINFVHRRAQDYTRQHLEPPNPPETEDWVDRTLDHTVRIRLEDWQLASCVWDESEFWYVGVKDADGQEILRADAHNDEIRHLLFGHPDVITLVRQFESTAIPALWEVRPCVSSKGWLDPIAGELVGTAAGHWDSARGLRPRTDGLRAHDVVPPLHADRERLLHWRPRVLPHLRWTETEGGFLARDRATQDDFLLNNTGALVLELSNGRHSVGEIIEIMQVVFALPEPPLEMVESFLDSALRSQIVQLQD